MPSEPNTAERLSALGLSSERPYTWFAAAYAEGPDTVFNDAVGVVGMRMGHEGQEFLVCARSPEGDAALIKMLGLNVCPVGWAPMTPALAEAEERGLCVVHQQPRQDGRYFVAVPQPTPPPPPAVEAERDSVGALARALAKVADQVEDNDLADALARVARELDPSTVVPSRTRVVGAVVVPRRRALKPGGQR
jgi:hypothetical protein